MKKQISLLVVMLVMAAAAVSYGFTTSGTYSYGKGDGETTMAVVAQTGAPIYAGQWVVTEFSDEQGYETGAVVVACSTENSGRVIGVAETGGDTGAFIRIRTWGKTVAYLNGADSGTGGGITTGTILAGGRWTGTAGAASTFLTAQSTADAAISAAQAATTRICGFALETVATTDTGSLRAQTYDVFVMCR